jgi:hypothetical protein
MNKTQQGQQEIFFIAPFPPFEKEVPTAAQLQSWENGKKYGVWINDKRVANESLTKYKASDFSHVFVSALSKNAINYGKHYVQVNLMTNAYYKDYYEKEKANTKNTIAIRRFKSKEDAK